VDINGRLRISHGGAAVTEGVIHNVVAARDIGMVQSELLLLGGMTNTSLSVGLIAEGVGGDISGYVKSKQIGPLAVGGDRLYFLNRIIDGVGSGADLVDGVTVLYNVDIRMNVFADVSDALEVNRILQGFNDKDAALINHSAITLSLVSGQAVIGRFQNSDANDIAVGEFYYHTDKIVAVNSLPTGYKAKLLNATDGLLLSATEVAGTASLDVIQLWMAEAVTLQITTGADAEVARIQPASLIWGGDIFQFLSGGISLPIVTVDPLQDTWVGLTGSPFVQA